MAVSQGMSQRKQVTLTHSEYISASITSYSENDYNSTIHGCESFTPELSCQSNLDHVT